MYRHMMKILIGILIVLNAGYLNCAETVKSDKSASASKNKQDRALMLNVEKTRHDSIASLDYSVKWDFSDISSLNIFSKKFYSSFNPMKNWDITDNTRFKMSGFSVNPWRIIIKKEEVPPQGSGIFVNEKTDEARRRRYKKKMRFSLYPIYNELTKDMESQIKEMLLKESFKGRLPGWGSADKKTKKLFINDLLSVDDLWNVPGIDKTKEGFEYLRSDEKKN